ncbi:MAG: glycine zipper family protein [Sedimentitalea sp.]|nr:glycine zipper family protein [Sedimentitalea sp.]
MIHLKTAAIGAILCLTAACATTGANVVPVVDGPVSPNFNSDLAQCQALARSQPVMSGSTAGSAAIGAGVGAATAAIVEDTGSNIAKGAGVGALVGATSSAVQANANREVIVRNCMRGRGHNVVG